LRTVRLLGAERQAASSMALAYPERRFAFLSDQTVVDGWDLPNVNIHYATPDDQTWASGLSVTLCPRWLTENERARWSLNATFKHLAEASFEHLLPVQSSPESSGIWQVKGNVFHRPDAPESGKAMALADIVDPHGCGLVYQPKLATLASYLVMGRRLEDRVALGVMRIHAERFFRDDVIQAAQTVRHPFLVEQALRVLDSLSYQGYFTLNWVETNTGLFLSSFRPTPRVGFRTLRDNGADLLSPTSGTSVAAPGGGFVAQPHYASYIGLRS